LFKCSGSFASTPFLRCFHAILTLLLRHSYNASTPFLQNFHAILTKPLFYPPKSLPNNYTNITQPKHIGLKKIPDVRPLYSFKFAKKLTEKKP